MRAPQPSEPGRFRRETASARLQFFDFQLDARPSLPRIVCTRPSLPRMTTLVKEGLHVILSFFAVLSFLCASTGLLPSRRRPALCRRPPRGGGPTGVCRGGR